MLPYHQQSTCSHLLPAQKNKTRATQKSLPFGKWRFRETRSGEWAKSRKGSDRNSERTRRKNKRGDIEKWDQTNSPEIPDRGFPIRNPRPPFGGACGEKGWKSSSDTVFVSVNIGTGAISLGGPPECLLPFVFVCCWRSEMIWIDFGGLDSFGA